MIQQTSLDAFAFQSASGKLSANERIILDCFEQFPEGRTNFEIAEILNWSINRVTPRTNSLVKRGKLFAARRKVNLYTGMRNIVWVACVHRPLYESLGFEESESVSGRLPPFNPSSKPSYSQEVKV